MDDYIFEDFELYFPLIAQEAVDWEPQNDGAIIVRLEDGTHVVYEYHNKTVRTIHGDADPVMMSEQAYMREFAARLNRRAYNTGIPQKKLSELTGIHQVMLSRYMTAKALPTVRNLGKLARALKCSIKDLTGFE